MLKITTEGKTIDNYKLGLKIACATIVLALIIGILIGVKIGKNVIC